MAFQFQCPQGHLLSGDESQAGQHCHCPTCGMLFIIPQPIAAPAAASPFGGGGFDPVDTPSTVGQRFDGGPGALAGDPMAVAPGPTAPPEPEILHIPCPNGHELDTPVEMLEQEVLCPKCNAQFRLRRKDSVEFKKKKEQEDHIRMEKVGNAWLNWAIVAVVLVLIGLVGLMIMSAMNQ
ncbi:MAG: hypothetical protein SFU86_15100 [Pirellulaceae bacterium]|nr:hypothetical protein [Pirellulaceae bacterium]